MRPPFHILGGYQGLAARAIGIVVGLSVGCSSPARTKVTPSSVNVGSTHRRTSIEVGAKPEPPKPIVIHLVMPGVPHAPTPADPSRAADPQPALPPEPRPTPAKDAG